MIAFDNIESILQHMRTSKGPLHAIGLQDFLEWPGIKQKEFLFLMIVQLAMQENYTQQYLKEHFPPSEPK